ncbi:conserved hypothetical protein [Candidatus Terasakiella magnetica]|nr:conserved hypothetical protein [Candidatus Terasakiella magnetica]
MRYRWDEIDQLATILEAEAAGQPVNSEAARELATRLRDLCPDIARTMSMVAERFELTANSVAA